MYILGICNDETASASLMVNGEIICAVSEERFTRVKLDSAFPENAIRFCIEFAGISLKDIDVFAYSWSKGFDESLLSNYVNLGIKYGSDSLSLKIIHERIKWEIHRDLEKRAEMGRWIEKNVDKSRQRVIDFYHHEAHAASAGYYSPFDRGIVFTSDGRGDFESTTLYKFDRQSANPLSRIFSASSVESFGYFYGRITALLGFTPMRHEGKITGLAAYGNKLTALDFCRKMIRVIDGEIVVNLGNYYSPFFSPLSDELIVEAMQFKKEDIAAAAQYHLECMMKDLLSFHMAKNGITNTAVMCAGGVFANVKVTQQLKELPLVSNIYVQPQMGDGGLCLGACALAHHLLNQNETEVKKTIKQLKSVYLGPEAKLRGNHVSNSSEQILSSSFAIDSALVYLIESLKLKKIIGLIIGRMEFGPRALCNRSIIAHTSDHLINLSLNARLRRTEFMPFAPVVREETAHYAFINFSPNDPTFAFMTSTASCTAEFIKRSPAVVHVDGTARPQVVTETSHNFIWRVLSSWEETSGEMSLINTSFNIHEEPIICDVDEGIIALRAGVIDELWVVRGNIANQYLFRHDEHSVQ